MLHPDFFSHKFSVLSFSAGKDSAACLKLLEPYLQNVIVAWANPGNPFPAVRGYMDAVKARVPYFVEVKGEQPKWIAENGYPLDWMPVTKGKSFFVDCCSVNMWQPLDRLIKGLKATAVVRGQKNADAKKNIHVADGTVIDGVQYFMPLQNWSDEEVFEFLGEDIPPGYTEGMESSLDCVDCTAYLAENKGKLSYVKKHVPEQVEKLTAAMAGVALDMSHLDKSLHDWSL